MEHVNLLAPYAVILVWVAWMFYRLGRIRERGICRELRCRAPAEPAAEIPPLEKSVWTATSPMLETMAREIAMERLNARRHGKPHVPVYDVARIYRDLEKQTRR